MEEQASSAETAPKKKSRRGCLIAAIVVVVLAIIVVAVAAIFLVRFSKTEQGQAILGLAQGSRAPGTEALRAEGCAQAFVVEMDQLISLGDIPGIQIPKDKVPTGMAVVCQTSSVETDLTCDSVSQTYVKALGGPAPHPFTVLVGNLNKGMKCMQSYAGDGTSVQ